MRVNSAAFVSGTAGAVTGPRPPLARASRRGSAVARIVTISAGSRRRAVMLTLVALSRGAGMAALAAAIGAAALQPIEPRRPRRPNSHSQQVLA